MPDTGRSYDVGGLITAELERARRDLAASLALARPGSPARIPITTHLAAIDTELVQRHHARPEDSPGSSRDPA